MDVILNKIYELMEKQGLNARNFEIKVGISNGSIQSWKIGKAAPSRRTLARISEAFDLPENYFYTEPAPKAARPQSNNLTARESELLSVFNSLSPSEQGRVLGYAKGLAEKTQSDVG